MTTISAKNENSPLREALEVKCLVIRRGFHEDGNDRRKCGSGDCLEAAVLLSHSKDVLAVLPNASKVPALLLSNLAYSVRRLM